MDNRLTTLLKDREMQMQQMEDRLVATEYEMEHKRSSEANRLHDQEIEALLKMEAREQSGQQAMKDELLGKYEDIDSRSASRHEEELKELKDMEKREVKRDR